MALAQELGEERLEEEKVEAQAAAEAKQAEEQSEEDKTKAQENEVAEKLQNIDQKIDSNEILRQVQSIPEVRQVLVALKEGRKIKVVDEVEEVVEPETPPIGGDKPLEELTNQEFQDRLLQKLGSSVDKVINKKFEAFDERMKKVDDYVSAAQNEKASSQIEEAKKKFPDLAKYKEEMRGILENPNLTVEELLLLSKRRKGELESLNPKLDTEKPSGSSGRPSIRQREAPLPPGKKGFDQLLRDGLGRLNLESAE